MDDYHFTGTDHSWLAAHGLNAFWNWLVEWVPLWVAPNVLTLTGFLVQVLGFAVMSNYNPDFLTPAPVWVYFFVAASLFVYQSLDNIGACSVVALTHTHTRARAHAHAHTCTRTHAHTCTRTHTD